MKQILVLVFVGLFFLVSRCHKADKPIYAPIVTTPTTSDSMKRVCEKAETSLAKRIEASMRATGSLRQKLDTIEIIALPARPIEKIQMQ